MTASSRKGVLVTGCSSGIGKAIAVHLSRNGFTVFATVRRERHVDELKALGNPDLIPVYPLDLTNREHISNAVEFVRKELSSREIKGLYAVVNNAGGGEIAPLELCDLDRLRAELETRIVAPIALLQDFIPLIREAMGRILWIVTPALIPVPYVSSIHACDFAVNCIARTLQLELAPWRIPNIMIRCGGIQTAAPGRTAHELEESIRRWPGGKSVLYKESILRHQEGLSKFDEKRTHPDRVAEVVHRALMARNPRSRYSVGHLARAAAIVDYLPQPLTDFIMARRG